MPKRNSGNRTGTTTNGRQEDYTPNALNQYTGKGNAGMIDVAGTAESAAIVTVNETPTTRQGAYFAGTAAGDNSSAAVSITANIHAVRPGAGPAGEDVAAIEGKSGIVPPANESFTYDDDGNLPPSPFQRRVREIGCVSKVYILPKSAEYDQHTANHVA